VNALAPPRWCPGYECESGRSRAPRTGAHSRSVMVRLRIAALAVLIAVTTAACGTATGSSPEPAGKLPSEISKMVCASEAQQKIALAIGVTAVVEAPTWINHLYSCRYAYASAAIKLSVKELSSWPQTLSYFGTLESHLGKTQTLYNLGQGAFRVRNGSVVVRKDWKVLLVDVSDLPGQFGAPPAPPSYLALSVADLILGCWSGD
jgi:hypothetical protein